jgi:hypothetical protein
MNAAADVTNPPSGWQPDMMFIKRQVHFNEPPNETENPFVRIAVEKNVVELDEGENGVLQKDINLEVRVDNVGALNVGPIFLDADLENAKQIVEVEVKALGQTWDGKERAPVRFTWRFEDQAEPRYWMIFTGQPDFVPKYQYRVRVIVKGSIFTEGMEWMGEWVDAGANGPIMFSVPTAESEGVKMRSLWLPGTLVPRSAISDEASAFSPRAGKPRIPSRVLSAPPRLRKKTTAEKAALLKDSGGGWSTIPTSAEWSTMASSSTPRTRPPKVGHRRPELAAPANRK